MPRSEAPFVLRLELGDADEGAGTTRLAHRLSAALIRAIAEGQLADGDVVPSSRTLARHLGLARSVVVEAYEELGAAGFFVSRPGSSTRVERGATEASLAGARSSSSARSAGAATVEETAVRPRFDLLPGFPDTGLIDTGDWGRAWRKAARTIGDPGGLWIDGDDPGRHHNFHRGLTTRLAEHLRRSRGMAVDPEDVFLFPGVNAAIRVLGPVALGPGRSLAFEDPGYTSARRTFEAGGAVVRPVPVDDEGLVVAELRDDDGGVYVTPAHQYPMGARLPVRRRTELLRWASENSAVIFEDDYDGEFRYDVAPMPALRAMGAGADRVIYLGTASKILSSDLRLAWAVVPSRLRAAVREAVIEEGEVVNSVVAAALAEFIGSGALVRQLASSHRTYSARRSRFAAACRELLPAARLHGVDAGLHLVLTFGTGFDDVSTVRRLMAAGIACAPLSRYRHDAGPARAGEGAPPGGLVCGYARLPETRAAEAVSAIRDVLQDRGRDRDLG